MPEDPLNLALRLLVFALLGLAIGWFINYLADILPIHRRLAAPLCRHCQTNLPPQSFLGYYLGLRPCPSCNTGQIWRYWLVLLLTGLGFIWIGFLPPDRLGLWGGWFWFAFLLLVTIIDIEQHLILHKVAIFGAAIAAITGLILRGWLATLLGGLVGAGIMLVFYFLGVAYARWSARRHGEPIAEGEALGFGDVTFSGVLGLLLGWPGVIAGLTIGILLAGAAGVLTLLPMIFRRQYNPNLALPYGPFLAAAAFYLLFLLK
jgi:leader peptidase (prepilin peptidase)/N-methyltransferase